MLQAQVPTQINPLPQPIVMHMGLAMSLLSSAPSAAALMSLKEGCGVSSKIAADVGQIAYARYGAFQAAIGQYVNAKIADWQPDAKIVAQIGSSRLLDFGGQGTISGEVILLVPPLINQANILDLSTEMSFVKKLKANSRVLVVDWGVPAEAEKGFVAADYVARLQSFAEKLDAPFHLLGYCMGGLLALKAAAQLNLKSLILLATPWNFEYLQPKAKIFAEMAKNFPADFVPPEMIQSLFFTLDPWRVFNKFAALNEKSEAAKEKFFLIEKWANSGVPMPKPLFAECMQQWIAQNEKGVDLQKIAVPVLAACPRNDKIVPLSASLAVAEGLSNCTIRQFDCGHIGLVTKDILVPAIFDWIR